jgi:dTDP-glucose 4,6-dehydratase
MTNILVSGGQGFIGSNLIRYLLEHISPTENKKVFNLDILGHGSHLDNISSDVSNSNYLFVRGDINDIGNLPSLSDIDVIVNAAAETHVDRSIRDPSRYIRSNYDGTFALLDYARRKDISKFIQISTDEVYGEAMNNYSFKEGDVLNPSNPYSSTKAAADLLVNSYVRTYGLKATITRCTNNFGPNQYPEKLIPRTIIRILLGLPVSLYGNGSQIRDWLFVLDHVKAIDTVLRKGQPGQVYNISASNLLPNIEIVKRIASIMNEKFGKSTTIEFIEDRPGHDQRYSLDSTKIRSELEWKPEINFDDALESTILWYSNNRKWWQNLVYPFVMDPYPWKKEE